MTTVAVATIWKRFLISNYGSFFQHFALRTFLHSLGYDTFRVNDFKERFGLYAIVRTFVKRVLKAPIESSRTNVSLWKEILCSIWDVRNKLKFLKEYKSLIGEEKEAQDFEHCAAFIAGSDQVWTGTNTACWAEGVPTTAKKISYGASADWETCEKNNTWLAYARSALKRFSYVSVRELRGVEILSRIMNSYGQDCKRVVDPVFFLSKETLLSLAKHRTTFKRPVLFCYIVNDNKPDESKLKKIANACKMDLKVVAIQGADRFYSSGVVVHPSPCEFIGYIINSGLIITNSFHGLVLSLILEKQFVAFMQVGAAGQNIR